MTEKILTQELLKELLDYDPDTGIFMWKKRGSKWFSSSSLEANWNSRHAGNISGCNNGRGYVGFTVLGKHVKAHRMAWLYIHGVIPAGFIDHINHDKSDNRILNLRVVSNHENRKNLGLRADNTSGITGVSLCKESGLWISHIGVNGRVVSLGKFYFKSDAGQARKNAEIKYGFHANHGRENL